MPSMSTFLCKNGVRKEYFLTPTFIIEPERSCDNLAASFWFFVKFWGAKVSMHSWRGHALNTVRVLFRCVC